MRRFIENKDGLSSDSNSVASAAFLVFHFPGSSKTRYFDTSSRCPSVTVPLHATSPPIASLAYGFRPPVLCLVSHSIIIAKTISDASVGGPIRVVLCSKGGANAAPDTVPRRKINGTDQRLAASAAPSGLASSVRSVATACAGQSLLPAARVQAFANTSATTSLGKIILLDWRRHPFEQPAWSLVREGRVVTCDTLRRHGPCLSHPNSCARRARNDL
jgi:hypothetical protein